MKRKTEGKDLFSFMADAVRDGRDPIIKDLSKLPALGVYVSTSDEDGFTLLHFAASSRNHENCVGRTPASTIQMLAENSEQT